MNKIILIFFTLFIFSNCFSQTLVSNRQQIEKAESELKNEIETFSSCIVEYDIEICVDKLTKSANNEYKKYIVGGILYEIDPKRSFILHEEAFLTNKLEQNFILEYAIELHRNGQYNDAAKLYEIYAEKVPNDIRAYVWLADCYINIDEIEKSITNWRKSNHSQNHTKIDNAIFTIYGKTTQIKNRNDLKSGIEKGQLSNFYPLIFLDKNWESDWWNKHTQKYFLSEDIQLAKSKLGELSSDFKTLKGYLEIKDLEEKGQVEEIKKILISNKIILEINPIPKFGEISSDLLRICFTNNLLNESDFYSKRGIELLELAKKTNDKDILNIYAYLQAKVDGKVEPEIDKLGWKVFKDERFAKSYFSIRVDKINSNDVELNEALVDFPNSSYLYWVKAKCAKMESKPVKEHLVELIKREFKTLGSDKNRFSYRLNSYINTLAIEK